MWTVGGTFQSGCPSIQIPAGTLGPLPSCRGKGAGKETAALARAHLQPWYCREIWWFRVFYGFCCLVWFGFCFGFFISSVNVSAAQQVGQGEQRSAPKGFFFSLCQCDETLGKKHETRQQYISLLCSPCLQSAAPGE